MSTLNLMEVVAGRGAFRLPVLSLTATSGTLVALLGRNGSGKTTLLKTMAGLLPPISGKVMIDDADISEVAVRERAGMAAYLPPPGEVDAPFSACHVVALARLRDRSWPQSLTREDRNAAQEALAIVGAGDLSERPLDRLSSGQRQLVLIARVLAQDSALSFLDEPSATLDPGHRATVFRTVEVLLRRGRTVVFSTHDPEEARKADMCLTIGPTITAGQPAELLRSEALDQLYGGEISGVAPKAST